MKEKHQAAVKKTQATGSVDAIRKRYEALAKTTVTATKTSPRKRPASQPPVGSQENDAPVAAAAAASVGGWFGGFLGQSKP